MSASDTPLTDSKAWSESGKDDDQIIMASDCRAIELRLNAAVEVLEQINHALEMRGGFPTSTALIKEAIANARKPLCQ